MASSGVPVYSGLRARAQRPRAQRPKRQGPKKPMSDQQKKSICKEEVEKHQTLFFPPLQEKGELSAEDIRNHLPTKDLNQIYYKAAKNLASGHGRATFTSKNLGSGTVTLKIKLQLTSEQALKMSSGIVNRAQRETAGPIQADLLSKMIKKGDTEEEP